MKTSVVGFSRIGKNRELKFATEKYFKGELTEAELRSVGASIREENWKLMKENGIDLIPSNDFSFYDNVLDTVFLLGLIPERYRALDLSELDTYFAMARGYQGKKGDVTALSMKKWFNTNYHYLVPEIDKDSVVKLDAKNVIAEYEESKKLGVETKVCLVGLFTFLKLATYADGESYKDYVDGVVNAYKELLGILKEAGVKVVEYDEPSLVKDLDASDKELFVKIYSELLKSKDGIQVILQTYFGDIRDVYEEVSSLDFDYVGIDFVEGRLSRTSLPKGKTIIAGVVNGKNIWKNNYDKSLEVINFLKGEGYDVVIGSSCSFLHVPYSLESETKLSFEYREHLAFAKEKLLELSELSKISDQEKEVALLRNRETFAKLRVGSNNEEVKKRVSKIKDEDYTRLPAFEERRKLQSEALKLDKFPTTTIGSFPQTEDVKRNRKLYRNGDITKKEYEEFLKGKIRDCVRLQEDLGLDVLVHGEYERNDMVEYFGENLDGYVFTEKAWVQSYGTRCVKPPIIWGDISRKKVITVDWIKYAKSVADERSKAQVKGMLTGPVTILNWSFPREDIGIKESILQLALAIRDEVLDLEEAGIKIIQIDEAALREKLPLRKSDWNSEYLDFAIPAFRLVHSKVKADTQIHTHMCYSEFSDIIPAIDAMDADVITFEASRSNLSILKSLKENHFKTQVGPGVYDIHSPRVPAVKEMYDALKKMLEYVDEDKLWVNPDCGLKTRGEEETKKSLENLVNAAKELRLSYK